ncbi:MAG: hypothetical protein UY10_C0005G0004 [Microgenomates group bacterium GW2011_GWA2_47_8]|nr:MAG: hypothetical protein UY10_C0005G0004 [Microgenomates group bacterium GW2011_GWA2_47_8]
MQFNRLPRHIIFHSILIFILFLVIVIPAAYHSQKISPGNVPTFSNLNNIDYFFYLSNIRQGGDFGKDYDLFTTELPSDAAAQFHRYYIYLGKIGAFFGLEPMYMYYAGLFFADVLYYFFCWKITGIIFPKKSRWRWLAMVLVYFLSPLPRYTINIFGTPVFIGTTWWTYLDPYSRLLAVPHHMLGQAFMLGQVYFFLRYLEQ